MIKFHFGKRLQVISSYDTEELDRTLIFRRKLTNSIMLAL